MYIATCTAAYDPPLTILSYLPRRLRRYLYSVSLSGAYEIHLGAGLPLAVYYPDGRYFVTQRGILTKLPAEGVTVTRGDIENALELITDASVYSVKNELCGGFVTIRGGHRVGIAGSAVIRGGKVSFVKDIASLNYRIASEKIGAADKIIEKITDGENIKNVLFVSPPGAGKTTILRDTARQLSNIGFRVSVIDERREIAAMYGGQSPFDLGPSCDVLSGVNKSDGMLMLLRSMSPEIIITDELGADEDFKAVEKLLSCGVAVIASVHGKNASQARRRCGALSDFFDVIITMSKRLGAGTIEDVTMR